MSKRGKKSKSGKHHHVSSESDSSSSSSRSSSSSNTSSDSENDRIPVKKQKCSTVSKKRHKKERRKLEKSKKIKETSKITKDDFYSKSIEFRLWLTEEKKLSMDEMKTTKAKVYFKKFVKKWNSGKLLKKYYKGIDSADVKSSLTKYRWKFADKANIQDIAGSSGASSNPFISGDQSLAKKVFSTFGKDKVSPEASKKVVLGPEKPVLGPQRPPHLFVQEDGDEDKKVMCREKMRTERKQFRDHDKLVMEELAPKATGFDAKIEKKLMRKQRCGSPEISDVRLMGSGMDHATMMRKKHKQDAARRERNIAKASVKLREYQEKENAKMKALLDIARASKSKDALW